MDIKIIDVFQAVIDSMPDTFDSHKFIKEFIRQNESEHISNLIPVHGGYRIQNSQIGQTLWRYKDELRIEKVRKIKSENIKGYNSFCTEWKKKVPNNNLSKTNIN